MSTKFPGLTTLDQAQRQPRPHQPKQTRLERAEANQQADRDDKRKLEVWARAVKNRDEWKDRLTGARVKAVLRLLPDRAEAHHVEPRANYDTRYDVRNGLTLSLATHERVERNEIQIVGTRHFTVNGKQYINCDFPVKFIRNGKVIHVG